MALKSRLPISRLTVSLPGVTIIIGSIFGPLQFAIGMAGIVETRHMSDLGSMETQHLLYVMIQWSVARSKYFAREEFQTCHIIYTIQWRLDTWMNSNSHMISCVNKLLSIILPLIEFC